MNIYVCVCPSVTYSGGGGNTRLVVVVIVVVFVAGN